MKVYEDHRCTYPGICCPECYETEDIFDDPNHGDVLECGACGCFFTDDLGAETYADACRSGLEDGTIIRRANDSR